MKATPFAVPRWSAFLLLGALGAIVASGATACASSRSGENGTGGGGSGGNSGGGGDDATSLDGGFALGSDATTGDLAITPANPTLTVTITDGVVNAPTQQFAATQSGQPASARWSIDRGEIGSIDASGLFTPTGTTGGTANVLATVGSVTASTTVTVLIKRTQNGFTGPIDLSGAGGYGGVGGVGPGGAVSPTDLAALMQAPTADPMRAFLYPYDGTVWPRGLLAPLLQWSQGANDATAIGLHLQSKTFVYDGYFGRPAALGTGPFVNHPVPQDVWQQANESTAATDPLKVSIVFLAQGAAVGPIAESWLVAPGILQGTVYYESYGTLLLQNSPDLAQDGTHYGAAVLAIKAGDTGPHVVAGVDSPSGQWGTGCRGCHSVAANGSRLITQDDVWDYTTTSLYDLHSLGESTLAPPAACAMTGSTAACPPGTFAWAGLSPDGQYALTNGYQYATGQWLSETQLFQMNAAGAATQLTVSGLPPGVEGMTPAFSPDGQHIAFTHRSGTLGTRTGDGHVVVLDFNAGAPSVGAPTSVFTPPTGDCVGFPSFMPTNDSLLVELQLSACYTTQYGPSYVGTGKVNGEDLVDGHRHRNAEPPRRAQRLRGRRRHFLSADRGEQPRR